MVSVKKRATTFMKGGKKTGAEQMVTEAVQERERRYGKKGEKTGEERRKEILTAVKPTVETKSMKRSGLAHQVPTPVKDQRGRFRACKWVNEATWKRSKKRGIPRGEARRRELRAVYEDLKVKEKGGKVETEPRRMRERRHRAAKANRVFATER
jgi:ribosomal protein S7